MAPSPPFAVTERWGSEGIFGGSGFVRFIKKIPLPKLQTRGMERVMI